MPNPHYDRIELALACLGTLLLILIAGEAICCALALLGID